MGLLEVIGYKDCTCTNGVIACRIENLEYPLSFYNVCSARKQFSVNKAGELHYTQHLLAFKAYSCQKYGKKLMTIVYKPPSLWHFS